MAKGSGPSDIDVWLADCRANQAAKRTVIPKETELDELRACRDLAMRLFGTRGVVEFPMELDGTRVMGHLRISVFLDPPNRAIPGVMRRTRPMFQGATYAELVEQANLWAALR